MGEVISINQIYDFIVNEITASREVYCVSRLEPVPQKFPSVQIVEFDHAPIRGRIPLNFSDQPMRREFEAHVFSNLRNGALSEARSIMTDVEDAFRRCGFIETYCGQSNNVDPSVIHYVARFTRNIGINDDLTL